MHIRILKMTAISGFLTASECTEFVFGRGFVPTPLREPSALPRPPSWFKGPGTSKGRRGKRRRGEEGRGDEGKAGKGRKKK